MVPLSSRYLYWSWSCISSRPVTCTSAPLWRSPERWNFWGTFRSPPKSESEIGLMPRSDENGDSSQLCQFRSDQRNWSWIVLAVTWRVFLQFWFSDSDTQTVSRDCCSVQTLCWWLTSPLWGVLIGLHERYGGTIRRLYQAQIGVISRLSYLCLSVTWSTNFFSRDVLTGWEWAFSIVIWSYQDVSGTIMFVRSRSFEW